MIRPLLYRHLIVHHVEEKDGFDGFVKLANLVRQQHNSGSSRASWVHTLWFSDTIASSDECLPHTYRPYEALEALLPRLVSLKELHYEAYSTWQLYENLGYHHGGTLSKLSVSFFDHQAHDLLTVLYRFTALQQLKLELFSDIDPVISGPSTDVIEIPNLRLLELVAYDPLEEFLECFRQFSLPQLTTFKITARINARAFNLEALAQYMSTHGANITTFWYRGYKPNTTSAIFPHTPCLRYFEASLGQLYPDIVTELLQGLPTSVSEYTYWGMGTNLGYFGPCLQQMHAAVKQLPKGSALRTIRVVMSLYRGHSFSRYSWESVLGQADRRRMNIWKEFTDAAAGLLTLGVVVVDEKGVILTDVLRKMEEPESLLLGPKEELPGTTEDVPASEEPWMPMAELEVFESEDGSG
jgi:hypothetical protein